jgi:hypothetical protein
MTIVLCNKCSLPFFPPSSPFSLMCAQAVSAAPARRGKGARIVNMCIFAGVFHHFTDLGTSTHKHRSVAQVSDKSHSIVSHVCAFKCGE